MDVQIPCNQLSRTAAVVAHVVVVPVVAAVSVISAEAAAAVVVVDRFDEAGMDLDRLARTENFQVPRKLG